MFTIFTLLILVGAITYTNMQASKRRAQEAAERKHRDEEDAKMPKVAVDRAFITSVSRSDGSKVEAEVDSVSKILRSWNPQPRGEEVSEGEYDDLAQDVIQQLRKDVDGEKIAKVLRRAYLRKYVSEPQNVDGIATYIANWWRAYILT